MVQVSRCRMKCTNASERHTLVITKATICCPAKVSKQDNIILDRSCQAKSTAPNSRGSTSWARVKANMTSRRQPIPSGSATASMPLYTQPHSYIIRSKKHLGISLQHAVRSVAAAVCHRLPQRMAQRGAQLQQLCIGHTLAGDHHSHAPNAAQH